jgi:hypothetical protein
MNQTNCILLMTPDAEVGRRVAVAEFVDFVAEVHRAIEEALRTAPGELEECQVACAILPGCVLIVDVNTWPPSTTHAYAVPITRQLRRLRVPSATAPLAFAVKRRVVASGEAHPLPTPFSAFKTRTGPGDLDEILLRTVGLASRPTSLRDRLGALVSRRAVARCAETLASRTGMFVLAPPGSVVFGASSAPFQIEHEDPATGTARLVYPSGGRAVVDAEFMAWFRSEAVQPTQASLAALLERTASVRVLEGGTSRGKAVSDRTLVTVGFDALGPLFESLPILDGSGGHCMCLGGPSLELRARNGDVVAVFGIHHGHALRWGGWKDDARLLDGMRVLEWLAAHGVGGPLAHHREAERAKLESEAARARWVTRMPDALKAWSTERWQTMIEQDDVRDAVEALSCAGGDILPSIRALFEWLGSSRGPWTGVPAYELFPERLLLAFPVDSLVKAADDPGLSDDALEGVARLFAGHGFTTRGVTRWIPLSGMFAPNQQVSVPTRAAPPVDGLSEPLLARLRVYTDGLEDEDKAQRARSAFGGLD